MINSMSTREINCFKSKKSPNSNKTYQFKNGTLIPYRINETSLNRFLKFVWKCDLVNVKKLMPVNYKKVDCHNRTALHLAAAKGHLAIIKELVNNYEDEIIDLIDDEGKTPLFKAVERGVLENVEWLYKRSKMRDIRDVNGNNLIHASVYIKNKEVLEFLLTNNIDPNVKNKDGNYPLHICADKDFPIGIVKILKFSHNVNVTDKFGRTALIIASQKDRTECIQKLLEFKANPDIKDQEGNTAYSYAELYDHRQSFDFMRTYSSVHSKGTVHIAKI